MPIVIATLLAALALTGVQFIAQLLPKREPATRNRWLSAAGGFSAALAFLHLLPGLEEAGTPVAIALSDWFPFLPYPAHAIALAGLITMYGLERLVRKAERTPRQLFVQRLVYIAFTVYYASVGYLLWDRAASGLGELATFTAVMALHVLAIDYGLALRHSDAYTGVGRGLLNVGPLVGWAAGAFDPPIQVVGVLLSFVVGAVILIAINEELPSASEGHFRYFALGAFLFVVMYAV